MTFHVGQKVVCVRARPVGNEVRYATSNFSGKIRLGATYTIREVDTRALHLHGCACVRVEEIINPVRQTTVGLWEDGYPAPCFRPIIERKTDIAIFTALLTSSTTKEGIDA